MTTDALVVSSTGAAQFLGRRFPCALGRGGVIPNKREGDGGSPRGVFRLEKVLYRADRGAAPPSALPARAIGPFDGWSDDPDDPRYNTEVRLPHRFSSERLSRPDPLYDLVVIFDANRKPIVPGRGSALFIHVWRGPRRPTEGCIAFALKDLLWILARCTSRTRLVIGLRNTAAG